MKKLLIVVDYQRDFVDGSLGFPGAERYDSVISEKIAAYRRNGNSVVFTLDTHTEHYLTTQEGKNLPVAHCIRNEEGWKLFGKTGESARSDDLFFEKDTFGSASLFDWLRANPFDTIELCGLVSNICVLSNAVIAKTAQPEALIIVDAAATGSFDPSLSEKTLDILEGLQVTVLNRESNQ